MAKPSVPQDNHEAKPPVPQDNHEAKPSVPQDNHEAKPSVPQDNHEAKPSVPQDEHDVVDESSPQVPHLQMQGITKSFLGTVVLDDVDLDCHLGEVHAVVGENGAGKSTLMKVLAGAYQPDAGRIVLAGEEQSFHHPVQAQSAGVTTIYQEFNLLPERTVAENVFIGREPARFGLVDRGRIEERTADLLDEIGEHSFSPRSRVGDLSVAQQQIVELVKARSLDARILVMDEPTAALGEEETDVLLDLVRRLRDEGLGILYISHRLGEVIAVADRITVLKDGQRVATLAAAETDADQLVGKMVGRELNGYVPPRASEAELGEVRLAVRGGSNRFLRDIDLELRAGEIVGIAGLQGAGRTELVRAIFGADPFTEGTVEIDGVDWRPRSPREGIFAGLGLLTEDRKAEGLALGQSVRDNALLVLRGQRNATVTRRRQQNALVEKLARSTELRAHSLEQEVRFLSGGNQQKVVLAKWLAIEPGVLLFDEPTRGIDIGAKVAIHELMRNLARDGSAVLMISSELPELIGMSDRIVVLAAGRVVGELPAGASEHEIIKLATAHRVPTLDVSGPTDDAPGPREVDA